MKATDDAVVHVELERLDGLLNLVGELTITRSALVNQARQARRTHGFSPDVLRLVEDAERLEAVTKELRAQLLATRLVPIGRLFQRFERLVADYCRETKKEARLLVRGGKTEVDKRTSDELVEPLVHLLRNALDHGLERPEERRAKGKSPSGTIVLEALHQGNRLVVLVEDDGAGVDLEAVERIAVDRGVLGAGELEALTSEQKLQLLFRAGFSTAKRVTDMSGRGVGLDSAWHRVRAAGGTMALRSERGRGSSVRIELPLTTAIVDALEVGVAGETFVLPLEQVRETIRARRSDLESIEGRQVIELGGRALRLVHLARTFELGELGESPEKVMVVVVDLPGGESAGLMVDRVGERREMVIKALGKRLGETPGVMGAAIDQNGEVVLLLDVPELGRGDGVQPRASDEPEAD